MRMGVLVAAALLIAACAATRVWLIPARISTNPNEGWNAFQAAAALGAGPLYPPPGGLTGNNYPPLSFFIVGWAGRAVGDPILAGRLISLLSVLLTAGSVFLCVQRLAPRRSSAPAIAALLLLGFVSTQYRSYLAMDDPQWLAHALMTAALAAILPARAEASPTRLGAAGAAALMVLGGMVKHNLVAFPLAVTVWLALHHRRALAVWLATAAAALLACAVAALAAFGGAFFVDLLAADRRYSAVRMLKAGLPVLAVLPLLALAVGLVPRRRQDTRIDLLLLCVAIALPLGVLQRAGEGVNVNAHFEALIALCICGGVFIAQPGPGRRTPAVALLLAAPFMVLAPLALRTSYREVRGHAAAQAAWAQMEGRVSAVPGAVACEAPALCYWAGEPFVLDMFLYGQHVSRRHDASALSLALDRGAVAAVQLDAPHPPRLGDAPDPLPALIAARGAPAFVASDGRRLFLMAKPGGRGVDRGRAVGAPAPDGRRRGG
ncbi:MAG: hypothetical protein INR64_01875 [Caulobacteraceae bacterium]|nr:hypothetical protein [Caulobacter sp.]